MMESSENQDNAIQLGKLLIDELGKNRDPDILSGWISHYIAELISKIESESGEAKQKAKATCFDAIMKLWDHRYSKTVGFSGIRNFEAIFDTLEKISPENPRAIYFDSDEIEDEDSEEVAELVNFAQSLDRITRRLLRKVLNLAAQAASGENTNQLVEAAAAICIPNDLRSIQLILQYGDDDKEKEPSELENCIAEMEAFAELTTSLAQNLKKEPQTRSEDEI
jgi:hypothetical protein